MSAITEMMSERNKKIAMPGFLSAILSKEPFKKTEYETDMIISNCERTII